MIARFNTVRFSQNPIAQVFAFLLGGLMLIGALFMGAIVLVVLLGAGAILGVVFWLRLLWLRHKFKGVSPAGSTAGRPGALDPSRSQRKSTSRRVIEVEYSVVEEDDAKDQRD